MDASHSNVFTRSISAPHLSLNVKLVLVVEGGGGLNLRYRTAPKPDGGTSSIVVSRF